MFVISSSYLNFSVSLVLKGDKDNLLPFYSLKNLRVKECFNNIKISKSL